MGLDQRLYVQTDVRGSTTSIASVSGAVAERYLYDQDGQPRALQANWSGYIDSTPNDSHFGFQYLWQVSVA